MRAVSCGSDDESMLVFSYVLTDDQDSLIDLGKTTCDRLSDPRVTVVD